MLRSVYASALRGQQSAALTARTEKGPCGFKGFDVIETEVRQLIEVAGFKAAGVRFDKAEARIIDRKHK